MPTPTIPATVRLTLIEAIEEIGTAMTLLRESDADANAGNHPGSQIVASDALEILANLEVSFSQMAARLATYSEQ